MTKNSLIQGKITPIGGMLAALFKFDEVLTLYFCGLGLGFLLDFLALACRKTKQMLDRHAQLCLVQPTENSKSVLNHSY
jgi:hypothetical protein